ncbi:MAG TPA: hypothetical protein VEA99_15755 [Gemmatimonadaceae bacterium]|nr:hypothetical protein [Gemmatimonadaceae bacterium]
MRTRTRALFTVSVLALLAACGPLRGGSGPEARVVFDNRSMEQADVYVVASGSTPVRIGTVFAGRRETLRVRGAALGGGSVNVIARLLGSSRAPRSGPVTLLAEDAIEVTLSPDGNMLSVLPGREP